MSNLDLIPTMLSAAGVPLPAGAPPMDGESLLAPTSRTTMFSEYYKDPTNGQMPMWKMIRTGNVKHVQNYDPSGNVTFKDYYNLASDPRTSTCSKTALLPTTPLPARSPR